MLYVYYSSQYCLLIDVFIEEIQTISIVVKKGLSDLSFSPNSILGALISRNHQGLLKPVMGLLYLFSHIQSKNHSLQSRV